MPESKRPDDDGPASDVRGAIRAEFDWSEVTPSEAVIEAVAIAEDREPSALEPLYHTIDTDALDALVSRRETQSTDSDTSVTFDFDGREVTVQSDGTVAVRVVEAWTEPN